ncbi:MAG: endonuclease V [Thermoplasmata archaeon]|nr:MAG: endonuclease V [Thermoplasmata archaeon]
MDLYNYAYDLVRQIPSGKISTYGAVARALGDIRASRAVGRMMNQNPDADTMPCFKIVQSDGHIGGFGLGIEDKIHRLQNDGINVDDGCIKDFDEVLFDDFKTEYPLKKLRQEQINLSKKLDFQNLISEKEVKYIAGFDVAYRFHDDWKESCGACVLMDYKTGEIVEQQTVFFETLFPYIPTFLSFREQPFIEKLIQKLKHAPSLLLIDGNGLLHPYQFGLACHIGASLKTPSIGVAKNLLCGTKQNNNIIYDNKILGYAFYANKRVKKPVYISSGNKISLKTAVSIVKKISSYKQPEPLRRAHILATTKLRKHQ